MSETSNAPAAEAAPVAPEAAPQEVTQEQPQEAVAPVDAPEASSEELSEVDQVLQEVKQEEVKKEAERIKRLKLKVNGKELEKEINFDDEDSLREIYQKALSSDEKFQQAAQVQKEMQEIAKLLQDDPISLLKEAGHDFDKVAESYLQERIQEMQKSPEQREIERLQKELAQREDERKKIEEAKMQAEHQRIQEEYARNLNDEISEGLSNSDIPKSPLMVQRIAQVLMVGLENGRELSVKDVIPYVEAQVKNDLQDVIKTLSKDQVNALFGEYFESQRQERVNKVKQKADTASDLKSTGEAELRKSQQEKAQKKEQISAKDFFKKLGR